MALRIDEVLVFVAEDKDGNEGVCAFKDLNGLLLPMVCADRERVESLREMANTIKQRSGLKIKLLKFSKRSLIEEI